MIRLGIVVPCFNEAEVLPVTLGRLTEHLHRLMSLDKISRDSVVCFVDDGSSDDTWDLISSWTRSSVPVMGVKLSRNCGHQAALLAGLASTPGDALVSIDADLQDDVDAIEKMVDAHHAGADIVYGVRSSRHEDSLFKRLTAQGFYRLLKVFGVETVYNHADFRLLSRRAVEWLQRFGESNIYLRGLVPMIGLPAVTVEYSRRPRHAGCSKYSLPRMLSLAWEAVTSFSIVPLRCVTAVGFGIFAGSVAASAWVLWARITGLAVPGWSSTVLPIFLLGGIQILGIGIVGEYLGKIYLETKGRPLFLIETIARSIDGATEQPGEESEVVRVRQVC